MIVAAFRGMYVSPAKHSYAWLPRKCHYWTDRQTPDKVIHLCRYASQTTGWYCTRRYSNSGLLVYENSALPKELKGIPSSRASIKQLVCTNTCDIWKVWAIHRWAYIPSLVTVWQPDFKYNCTLYKSGWNSWTYGQTDDRITRCPRLSIILLMSQTFQETRWTDSWQVKCYNI